MLEYEYDKKFVLQKLIYDGEAISLVLSFIFLTVMYAFPIVAVWMLLKKKESFKTRKFNAKYGSIMDGMDKSRESARLFFVYFLGRRFLIAHILIFMSDYQGMQIMLITFFSSMIFFYQISVFPFRDRQVNLIESCNQTSIILLCYFLYVFSDSNSEQRAKQVIGMTYSAVICLCVFSNLVFIVFRGLLKPILKKVKSKFGKKKKLPEKTTTPVIIIETERKFNTDDEDEV